MADELVLRAAETFESVSLNRLAEMINRGHGEIYLHVRRTALEVAQVGSWLTAAKGKCVHGAWLPWLTEKCPEISHETVRKYMRLYDEYSNLSGNLLPTAAYKMLGIVKDSPDNVHFSSQTEEWCTPDEVIEVAQQTMDGITLDPCSNDEKKPNVPADEHFTKDDDALDKDWFGKVYMNPPYGRVIEEWILKLKTEYEEGRVKEAIALVPSRTDTEWFRALREYPRCFIWGRLKFSGHENSAPFPSMLVYLGKNLKAFVKATQEIGDVYKLYD